MLRISPLRGPPNRNRGKDCVSCCRRRGSRVPGAPADPRCILHKQAAHLAERLGHRGAQQALPTRVAPLRPWAAPGSGVGRRRRRAVRPRRAAEERVGAPGECGRSHNTSVDHGSPASRRPGRLVAGRTQGQGSPFLRPGRRGSKAARGRPGSGDGAGTTRLPHSRRTSTNRGDRTRTCDIWFWRPALYQLSYAPSSERIVALPACSPSDTRSGSSSSRSGSDSRSSPTARAAPGTG